MYTNVKKNTKYIAALITLIIALVAGVIATSGNIYASAEQTDVNFTASVLKHSTDCSYRYFNYPTAVTALNGGFAVADGDKAYAFDDNGAELTNKSIITGARKFNIDGDNFIAVANGELYYNGFDCGNYTDYAYYDGVIYALSESDGKIYSYEITGEETGPFTLSEAVSYGKPLTCITANSNGIYVTAANQDNPYQDDILRFTVRQSSISFDSVCASECDKILQLESASYGVISLTRNKIISYTFSGSSLNADKEYECNAVRISAYNGAVYALSELKGVFKLNSDFVSKYDILASAGSDINFFRSNASVAARLQTIAVADERNDRIEIITESGATVITGVKRPKAVAIDGAGKIYAGENVDKISVFESSGAPLFSYDLPGEGDAIISLKTDSNGRLYVLTLSGRLYVIQKGASAIESIFADSRFCAIAVSQSDDYLYAADESTVYKLKGNEKTPLFNTGAHEIVDFTVDHDNSCFVLTKLGNVLKYDDSGELVITATPSDSNAFIKATSIVMSAVTFADNSDISLKYGDLIISDTGAHAVKVISGSTLEVNKHFIISLLPPDVPDEPVEYQTESEILYTVTEDCYVYPQKAETNPTVKLNKGMRVIVPEYDENAKFNYIIADNLNEGKTAKAVSGYVYTFCIRDKIPYSAPPSSTCYSFLPSITVYKYPSFNAPKLKTVEKDTGFTLLSFAFFNRNGAQTYGYADNYAAVTYWYRIAYEENGVKYSGYVINDSISMRGEKPDDRNVYPRVNAVIISKEKGKDLPAILYERNSEGKIVAVEDPAFAPLAAGTEVEVIGAFDSSEKYTQIKYYHKGIGTVTFYVETANIKYDGGVNKVVVIAIVIIVLTVILAAILIARYLYVKRNKRIS